MIWINLNPGDHNEYIWGSANANSYCDSTNAPVISSLVPTELLIAVCNPSARKPIEAVQYQKKDKVCLLPLLDRPHFVGSLALSYSNHSHKDSWCHCKSAAHFTEWGINNSLTHLGLDDVDDSTPAATA